MNRKQCARLLALLLLLPALTGCLKREAAQPEPEPEEAPKELPLRYVLQEYTVSRGSAAVSFQQAEDRGFLAIVNRKTGEKIPAELAEDPEYVHDGRYNIYENEICHVNGLGKSSKIRSYRPLPAPEKPEGLEAYFSESRLRAVRLLSNGSLAAIESSYECWQDPARNPQFQSRDIYYIRLLRPDGTEISTSRIQTEEGTAGLDCGNFVCLNDTLFAAPTDKGILFFGSDGAQHFSVSTPLRIRELCRAEDGRLAVILEQGEARWLSLIDAVERQISVPQELPKDAHGFSAAPDDSLLFRRNTELFLLSLSDYSVTRVDSLISIGVDPSEIAAMEMKQDGSLHFLLHDWLDEEETVREVYAIAKQKSTERQLLRVGFSEISGDLKEAILAFNRRQETTLLQTVDFRNGSGTAEDCELLILGEDAWRVRDSAGLLADLEPLLQAEDLLASVREGLSGKDGKLTRLAIRFRIESMAADSDTVAGRSRLSFSELRELLNGMPAGSSLYEPYYTSDRLLRGLQQVNPDTDPNLLSEFSRLQPSLYDYRSYAADTASMEKRIYDGRLLLLQAHVGTLEEFKYYDAFFFSGAAFVGWPTTTGSASRLVFDECIALDAECTHEQMQAAASFLQLLMSGDWEEGAYGFPTRSARLEKLIADDMAARSFRTDEDGAFVLDDNDEKIEIARSSWYSPEWRHHYSYALTELQRQKLMELIGNCR